MIYGLECVFKCSKCRNGILCYYVNGICIYGCVDGLYGDMCYEGLNFNYNKGMVF